MYQKSITMSFEQAAKISTDLLESLQILYDLIPLKLTFSVINAKTKVKTFKILPDRIAFETMFPIRRKDTVNSRTSREINESTNDEYRYDIIYKLLLNNRCFEITLFNDPDDCGYCSMLPDYDPSTYVLCDIVERRTDGSKKYEMTFGFDIEKRTFLELFEVLHFNTVGILREYPNLDSKLESELKDVVIL